MIPQRVAVVGGGISGLAAAFFLSQARRAGTAIEEHLFEASPRLGGALRTEYIDGCVVETGADSFLTEKREAIKLCQQLGLADQLIGSQDHPRRTLILHEGKLVPLPDGFEFLVPARLLPLARTPLLSLRDKLALVSEIFTRPCPPQGEESVARFIERHFSRGLLENIVDPLLTAIYGGDSDLLSASAVLPRFVEMEQRWGSLVRGVRHATRERRRQEAKQPEERNARASIFSTLRDGLQTLVAALHAHLETDRVICGRRVVGILSLASPAHPTGYRLHLEGNAYFDTDSVVLALPAYESARLLRDLDSILANRLSEIPYSSSIILALGYEARGLKNLPPAFGFLVPQKEKHRLLACTFVGHKFRSRVPSDRVVLRCFLGGARDEAVLELSDAEVAAVVQRDLRLILGIAADPVFLRVYRWPKAMAQYTVGHLERLRAIRSRLGRHCGLLLCGNAYGGIGIPDCIRSAKMAAEECLGQRRGE